MKILAKISFEDEEVSLYLIGDSHGRRFIGDVRGQISLVKKDEGRWAIYITNPHHLSILYVDLIQKGD